MKSKENNIDLRILNSNIEVIQSILGETPVCPNCGTDKPKHCCYWQNNIFKCFKCGYSTNPWKMVLNDAQGDKNKAWAKLNDIISTNNLTLVAKDSYKPLPIASPEKINKIYSLLIENSVLFKKDYNVLRARRLSKSEIDKRQFRSAESIKLAFNKLDAELKKDCYDVPGVYFDAEKKSWEFNIFQGIIIPVKNNDLIQGFQVRTNNPDLRYIWISAQKKGGVSPGAPFDEIKTNIKNGRALVTEGIFKSIQVERLKKYEYIFSVQGIGNNKQLVKHINTLHSQNKIKEIDFAFDMDVTLDKKHQGNKIIKQFENNLTFNLKKYVLIWSPDFKGIDDIPADDYGNIDVEFIKRKQKTK